MELIGGHDGVRGDAIGPDRTFDTLQFNAAPIKTIWQTSREKGTIDFGYEACYLKGRTVKSKWSGTVMSSIPLASLSS